ncbi:DJ-1/PfpI family protein [Glutamicibacter sp.]|uniref:DJ-1/PfpI family protein n=1 Tax=Glutamicibacter sp. TaxID=1931995 RepID=UPI0028BD9DB6|nr:DJ-1/PfpI family protein [Glutamicibacter sp.]
MTDLAASRVLAIVSNLGVEQDDLKLPVEHLCNSGALVSIAAPKLGSVHTLVDGRSGENWVADQTLDEVSEHSYDLLLVPDGTVNSDLLRTNLCAQRIAHVFAATHKTVAAIGHAPWLLASSKLLNGKSLTSSQSIRPDLENAGGNWVDEPVITCNTLEWRLITSRGQEDLSFFIETIDATLSKLSDSRH